MISLQQKWQTRGKHPTLPWKVQRKIGDVLHLLVQTTITDRDANTVKQNQGTYFKLDSGCLHLNKGLLKKNEKEGTKKESHEIYWGRS